MRCLTVAAAVACILPAALSAQTYRAINDLNVIPLGASTFEVIEARGEGPRGIWCAAAEYADKRLGADGRIYIREGRGPAHSVKGRKSVVFTTNPANLSQEPSRSVSVNTASVGLGLPVVHALQFCRDVFDREFDVWDRG